MGRGCVAASLEAARGSAPSTHRPRNGEVHEDDGGDLPPALVLAAVEEEDAPEGVQEDQHHGHEGCGEQQRGVNREPRALQGATVGTGSRDVGYGPVPHLRSGSRAASPRGCPRCPAPGHLPGG